jgi:ATP synthase protein I
LSVFQLAANTRVFTHIIVGFAKRGCGLYADYAILDSMNKPRPNFADETEDEGAPRAWTAAEAQAWRNHNPGLSPWRVVALQLVLGLLASLLVGVFSGELLLFTSAAWGVLAVIAPSAMFARALRRQMNGEQPADAALAGLLIWELAKIMLTVLLLVAAPAVVKDLSWLALLVGFVVAMKAYWFVFLMSLWRRK